MEIPNIAGQVHLELLVRLLQLVFVVNLIGKLLLLQVPQRLDRDDVLVADVVHPVKLLDHRGLLVAELEAEISQDAQKVSHLDQALVISDRVPVKEGHELAPVVGPLGCDPRVAVVVELENLLLVLLQVGDAKEGPAVHIRPAAFLVARLVRVQDRLRLLLPEVESLTRVDLVADALHEVLVRDLSVAILVKEAEDDILLFFV